MTNKINFSMLLKLMNLKVIKWNEKSEKNQFDDNVGLSEHKNVVKIAF
jgi:hypothetical protein